MLKKILFHFLLILSLPLQAQISKSIDQFGFELFYFDNAIGKNLLISPYSVCSSLYMAYLGAQNATLATFQTTLNLKLSQKELAQDYEKLRQELIRNGTEKGAYLLTSANSIWVDDRTPLLESYTNELKSAFDAQAQAVDFQMTKPVSEKINTWISQKTNGEINEVIQPQEITSATRLLLISTLHFEGVWKTPFNTKNSSHMPFYVDNQLVDKPLSMRQMASFPYYEDDDVQVAILPFQKGSGQADMAFAIFLPKKSDVSSLFQKYDGLEGGSFLSLLDQTQEKPLDLSIPRFTMDVKEDFGHTLKIMGLEEAFSPSADFSKINGKQNLSLSKVMSVSELKFRENGVSAASVTSTEVAIKATPPLRKAKTFRVNKPFFFMLLDLKSKTILYMGQVYKP